MITYNMEYNENNELVQVYPNFGLTLIFAVQLRKTVHIGFEEGVSIDFHLESFCSQ